MTTKRMKIGIMPPAAMRARTIAIAQGRYVPKPGEPKVWFPSIASVARLLSEENREMLRAIAQAQPESIAEAAQVVERHPNNLSRTLRSMERYGIVQMIHSSRLQAGRKALKPLVRATDFEIVTFPASDFGGQRQDAKSSRVA